MKKVVANELDYQRREALAKVMAPDTLDVKYSKSGARKLWDNYEEIASIQKSDRLKFVVAACTRNGFRCVNIREFYYVKRDEVWKPGRDGIMIPLVSPIGKTRTPDPNNPPKMIHPLEALLPAIEAAMEVAAEMDLEDIDRAVWLLPKVKLEDTTNED